MSCDVHDELKTRNVELGRAHEVLERKWKELDVLLVHSIVPLALLDVNLNFIRVSTTFAKVFRRDPWEFIGSNISEVCPSSGLHAECERAIETKKAYHAIAEPFISPHDPKQRIGYWDLDLTPVLDSSGETDFLILSMNDVTEHCKAQAALLEISQRYSNAERIAHLGHWDRNFVKDEVDWSEGMYRIFGVDRDEFKPCLENFLNLVHPSDREPLKSGIQAALAGGQILERRIPHHHPCRRRTIYPCCC